GGGLLEFTPDGRTLVTATHNFPEDQKRAFTRWDANFPEGQKGQERAVPGPRNVMVGRFSRDGRTVYLMSYLPEEARLGAYDAVTGADRFPGHWAPVCSAAFSPDGGTLASGDAEGRVCLWDLQAPPGGAFARARRLLGHNKQVFAVTFSPDGQLLASSSVDGAIRLSDVATGQSLHELSPGPFLRPVPVPLAFSPDGEPPAAGSAIGSVNLWAVKTKKREKPGGGHVGFVPAVAFS